MMKRPDKEQMHRSGKQLAQATSDSAACAARATAAVFICVPACVHVSADHQGDQRAVRALSQAQLQQEPGVLGKHQGKCRRRCCSGVATLSLPVVAASIGARKPAAGTAASLPCALTAAADARSPLSRVPSSADTPSLHLYGPCADMHRGQVVEQLRCAGVIEAIRISRAAYPNRLPHLETVRCAAPRSGVASACRALLNPAALPWCTRLAERVSPCD
jgi:hypothetical protein